ncbi:MAG: hypothetical protein BMS9Abin26_1869 [Gammaproteobacteria bacterium]|nr:MAG: hypothetical protein BMS9Abin26_1869 [Gammaproteobacteria bacterium]
MEDDYHIENMGRVRTPAPTTAIAGFWRRIIAFGIDAIIIGVIGYLLGFILYEFFVRIGMWARVYGFAIALAYLGIMNSSVAGGQSVGKRLLYIKVVDKNGHALNIFRSFIRYSILATPFFLNRAPISEELLYSWPGAVISILLFGVGFAIIYLFLFNRLSRQSLHDIISGSFVVNENLSTENTRRDVPTEIWKGHYILVALLFLTAGVLPLITGPLARTEFFSELRAVKQVIERQPEVRYAGVEVGTSISAEINQETRETTYILSNMVVTEIPENYQNFLTRIAWIILYTYPEARSRDLIAVTASYGYDIGIASQWQTYSASYPPDKWQKLIIEKRVVILQSMGSSAK